MAYQQDFLDDDKKEGSTGEQVLGSESSTISSAPSSDTATNTGPSNKGSGFTNLSQYVNANNEQAAGMADTVTSGIKSDLDSANQGTEQLKSSVGQTANQNTVKDQGVIGALQNSPQQFAQKEWQDLFKKETAGYQGPNDVSSLQPYQDLSKQYGNIDSKAKSLSDPNQIGQTIKDTYKVGPQYTQGQNTLDSFLLTSGAGANKINQFSNDYNTENPNQSFQNTVTDLNNQLQTAKDTTENNKTAVQNAYNSALGGLNSSFTNKQTQVAQESANASQATKDLQAKLKAGDVDAEKSIGLDPNTAKWLQTQGIDLSSLINAPTQSRSLGDVVSNDEQAGYQALLGLQPGSQSAYDFSKTGLTDPSSFNKSDKISQGSQAYELQKSLNDKLSTQQTQRNSDYQKAISSLGGAGQTLTPQGLSSKDIANYAQILGISPEDYQLAASHGLLDSGLISQGAKLNLGDVTGDSDRAAYTDLISKLGLSSAPSVQDTQNEGSAYSVNTAELQNRLKTERSKEWAKLLQSEKNAGTLNNTILPPSTTDRVYLSPASTVRPEDLKNDPTGNYTHYDSDPVYTPAELTKKEDKGK